MNQILALIKHELTLDEEIRILLGRHLLGRKIIYPNSLLVLGSTGQRLRDVGDGHVHARNGDGLVDEQASKLLGGSVDSPCRETSDVGRIEVRHAQCRRVRDVECRLGSCEGWVHHGLSGWEVVR